MASDKISHIYMKDLTSIIEALNNVDTAGEFLWLTGDLKVTDGQVTYTLVYEDDTWWLDTEQTTTKE